MALSRRDSRAKSEEVALVKAALGEAVRCDEPIGQRSTYRVGGSAALFVEIGSQSVLQAVCAAVQRSGIEVLVLGEGSNVLISEAGFPGLCVSLGEGFSGIEIDADAAEVEAFGGLAYPVLARRSVAACLGGMEWAVGIPGSVGGAVAMNAGGHGSETAQHLLRARLVDLSSGDSRLVAGSELAFSYRHSSVGSADLVLSASFSLRRQARATGEAALAEIVSWRRAHQPGGRNAGSVFTNPPGDAAGRLIEAAGLKGYRVGSAAVSEKHANFFQLDSNGKADDVQRLIEEVRGLVAERLGVSLVTELRLIGFSR